MDALLVVDFNTIFDYTILIDGGDDYSSSFTLTITRIIML